MSFPPKWRPKPNCFSINTHQLSSGAGPDAQLPTKPKLLHHQHPAVSVSAAAIFLHQVLTSKCIKNALIFMKIHVEARSFYYHFDHYCFSWTVDPRIPRTKSTPPPCTPATSYFFCSSSNPCRRGRAPGIFRDLSGHVAVPLCPEQLYASSNQGFCFTNACLPSETLF